jgi:CheY-like chemotaxis protein
MIPVSPALPIAFSFKREYKKKRRKRMEKPKVLVIDDDPDLVESIRITLEANNYEVYGAGNGTEGLRLVKETHPDLIILDVMMDSITEGFQVSYQLRSRDPQSEYKEYSHIPIIMLTGISQKMHMKFSTEADEDFLPVDEFMDKPIRLEALLERVKKLIQRN